MAVVLTGGGNFDLMVIDGDDNDNADGDRYESCDAKDKDDSCYGR